VTSRCVRRDETSLPIRIPKPNHLIAVVQWFFCAVLVQHLGDAAVSVHDNLGAAQRLLDGVLCVEDARELFERAPPRLDVQEVDEGELEYVPEDEEEVVLHVGVSREEEDVDLSRVLPREQNGLTFHPAPANAIPVTKVL
jgi:hypothetical protein